MLSSVTEYRASLNRGASTGPCSPIPAGLCLQPRRASCAPHCLPFPFAQEQFQAFTPVPRPSAFSRASSPASWRKARRWLRSVSFSRTHMRHVCACPSRVQWEPLSSSKTNLSACALDPFPSKVLRALLCFYSFLTLNP